MGRPISSSPPETIALSVDSTESMRLDTANGAPTEVMTAAPSTDAMINR
jgi:hypothetical protein